MSRTLFKLMASLMRRGPQCVRHWRLLSWSLRMARIVGKGMSPSTITTRQGFRLHVDLSDWLGQHVFATGDYEPATTHAIAKLLNGGETVIDIGANIGYFSMVLANRVGPSGRVFAFEPIPALRERLEKNVLLNGIGNTRIFAQAASDQAGDIEFFVGPQTHLGKSSLRPLLNATSTIQVHTIALDSVDFGDRPVALVKIDVEGAECAVLRGMRKMLSRDKPDIVIEVTDPFLKEFGDSAADLCGMLFSSGYRMFRIDYDGLTEVSAWSDELPRQFNALFTCRRRLPTSFELKQTPLTQRAASISH